MQKLSLLGGLSPAQFLKDYWQKKPLLIRQAIPGFHPLLTRDALFQLAARNDVESRLVSRFKQRWDMQHGPFDALPGASRKAWTLLVQGANLHNEAADTLLQQFRFIPDARLDDLMISYATDAGGVGPHFDSYDVFLLQAHGQRRWRISKQKDLSLIAGLPLKILQNFKPEEEFVLEPGDMLYLPPQYAHDGIAIGECMTYSIGFRAPAYQELGEAFLQFMAEAVELPGRYADPDLSPTRNPAEIGSGMLTRIAEELSKIRFTREDITIFLGEYLSEPKPNVFFEPPQRPLNIERFSRSAARRGIALSPRTRMLYRGVHVFINGESFIAGKNERRPLHDLANARRLDGAAIQAASRDVLESLHAWYRDGWIYLP
ncbi:cupin domain-containing protein [Noviherbaspirillum massiliense]|uniref:cupin domain-containing protein n=1 Tax=Noviherbaspirillum massiliense TaxID=1465823 RepID=UPI000375B7AE|nr:cupin domain-containing protein [Noviherbaspirillum massiliense]